MGERVLVLRDGRRLAYRLFGLGDSSCAPLVLYHHGWPSSKAEAAVAHEAAHALGARVVAFDRPGVGGSSLHTSGGGMSFQSVAADSVELLDALGVQRAAVMGTSGGGPYALACAALHPGRFGATALVAGMTHCAGPGAKELLQGMAWSNRLGYWAIANLPGPTHLALSASMRAGALLGCPLLAALAPSNRGSSGSGLPPKGAALQHQQQQLKGQAIRWRALEALSGLPQADLQALRHTGGAHRLWLNLVSDVVCRGAPGGAGLWRDMRLTTMPWGFDTRLASTPACSSGAAGATRRAAPQARAGRPVLVFQGTADAYVPPAMARHHRAHIPGAQLVLYEGDGHVALPLRRMHAMLAQLLAALADGSHEQSLAVT